MKAMLILLTTAVLGLGAGACGGASKSAGTASQAASDVAATDSAPATTSLHATGPGGYLKYDGDVDPDDGSHSKGPSNDDQQLMVAAGSRATRADSRAITTVVKSYYTAAAADDGTKACSLLYSNFAAGFAVDNGKPTSGAHRSCATYLSLLFKQQHQQLAADEVATMVVTEVHVKGNVGLAMLGFRTTPEGEIIVQREGRAWKINALFDSEMP